MPTSGAEAIVNRSGAGWRVVTIDGTTGAVTFLATREAAVALARIWLAAHQPGRLIVRETWDESEEIWLANG